MMVCGKKALFAAAAMAAGLGMLASSASAATEMVTNGGFETGNLSGWSAGYTSGNSICCYAYTGSGGMDVHGGDGVFGTAIGGSASAYGDWDGGKNSPLTAADYATDTDFFVRQSLTKSNDVTSATLTFSFNVAGGAYASYLNVYPGYTTVEKRDVTANLLGSDLSLQSNLYTFERPILSGNEAYVYGVQNVTLDVTTAFNAMADGAFFLDFGRNIPQYFTGGGYFVLDNVSLQVGEAVVAPPVGGVPEPASWAMMILGFGAAGTLLRRQRLALS